MDEMLEMREPLGVTFLEASRLSGLSIRTLQRRPELEVTQVGRRKIIIFKSLKKLLGIEEEQPG